MDLNNDYTELNLVERVSIIDFLIDRQLSILEFGRVQVKASRELMKK